MNDLKSIRDNVKKYVKTVLRYKISDNELYNIIDMCVKGAPSPFDEISKNNIIFMYVDGYLSTLEYGANVVVDASAVDPNDAYSIKIMLPKAISALEAVEKVGGAISQKTNILKNKDNINNAILVSIFKHAYDWTMSYGLGDTFTIDIDAAKVGDIEPHVLWTEFIELLNMLKSKPAANNEDRENVRKCLMGMPRKLRKWCTRIIYRDLRIGMKKANIKNIWGNNVLPMFEVSLCSSIKNINDISMGTSNIRIEPKYDGLRIIVIITDATNNVGEVYTRKGLAQPDLRYVIPQASSVMLAAGYNTGVFDCEGVGQSKNYNDAVTAVRKAETRSLSLMVFDYISVSGFANGIDNTPSGDRRRIMYKMFKKARMNGINTPNIKIVPTAKPKIGIDLKSHIVNVYKTWRDEGYEGVIIKDNTASYMSGERNRNKSGMYKIKPFETTDVEITGVFPGKPGTKYESTLGGLICKMENGTSIRVGGGFSDAERHEFWANSSNMIGRVIEVEMQSGVNNGIKARHTYFKRLREHYDK